MIVFVCLTGEFPSEVHLWVDRYDAAKDIPSAPAERSEVRDDHSAYAYTALKLWFCSGSAICSWRRSADCRPSITLQRTI